MDLKASNIHHYLPGNLSKSDAKVVINNMPDTLYRVNSAGHLTYVSPSCKELTGYNVEELLGTSVLDLYRHPEHRAGLLESLQNGNGSVHNYEMEIVHKDGHSVWVLINIQSIIENSELVAIEGLIRDVSDRKEIEQALFREKEKAQVTLQSIADGVITTDTEGNIDYLNPMAESMTGWSLANAKGKHINKVFCPVCECDDDYSDQAITSCLQSGESITVPCIRLINHTDNQQFAVRETASPIRNNNNEIIGAVLVFHDVTQIRDMSQQLSYQASHDSHTGLINRQAMEQSLQGAIEQAKEQCDEHVFCYLDLDQFKIVNDTCGHIAGDALLKQLSTILKTQVRENDTFARIGGDEFGVLIEHCSLEKGVEIAENIRLMISDYRFSWENKIFEVGVSIGLVSINADTQSITEVLSTADSACFIAKDKGRNRVHVSEKNDKALNKRHQEMNWSGKIKLALEQNDFTLHHQLVHPIDEQASEKPIYCEALIRLVEKDNIIQPMAFIPAAERYNLMDRIDRWVVSNLMNKLQQLPIECTANRIFALNLSGTSLTNNSLMSHILSELENTGVNPEQICFEITETAAVSNLDQAKRFILILGGVGFKFALDDFGSGLSSFNYLKYLPVDYLKIDGGIVRDVHKNVVNKAMVESINNIGHIMGLTTIAEFVENEEIYNTLKEIGVDYAQGYHVHKPEPFECDV